MSSTAYSGFLVKW